MKSDFIIKRNKKGKSESTLIKGEGEKEKDVHNLLFIFLIWSWRALKESWGFKGNPSRSLVSVLQWYTLTGSGVRSHRSIQQASLSFRGYLIGKVWRSGTALPSFVLPGCSKTLGATWSHTADLSLHSTGAESADTAWSYTADLSLHSTGLRVQAQLGHIQQI